MRHSFARSARTALFVALLGGAGVSVEAQAKILEGSATATPAFLRIPDAETHYPFTARGLPLDQALRLFSKNLRIGLEVADGVEGEVARPLQVKMTREEYLDALAFEFDFIWYFDGSVLRVSPVGAMETRILPLTNHDGLTVIDSLRALDVYQPKFVHRYSARSRTLRVTGPTGYLDLVEQAVEAIDQNEPVNVELVRGSVKTSLEEVAAE